jgi:tripartite ATP-independent transporter DctM subunit
VLLLLAIPCAARAFGGFVAGDLLADSTHLANHGFGWETLRWFLYDGSYPLLPWLCPPLLGALLALNGRTDAARWKRWIALGAVMVALGFLWGLQFPVVKKIWTSSFVLVAGGYSALLLAAFYYRELTWKGLYAVTLDGARASASIGLLIGGALIFNYIVAAENIPGTVSAWLTGIEISPLAFLVAVNLLLLVLGCLLDASTIILVILPLFVPTCKALGIDLVHFGVVTVVNAMIGLITPPYGVLLFVTNAVTGIPLRTMIAEIWGFIAVLVAALFAMILFPDIVLWLPRVFGYEGR